MHGAAELRTACLVEGIELLEPIGQGLCATVWRARWRERDVAVKVLGEEWDLREPRELDHPAILTVLARGRTLGRPYLVLERFPTDLRRLLDGQPLPDRLLRPVLLPLVDAVEHAHQRGVPHGDLKPANVLVDPAAHPPRVALTDFGHDTTQAALELEASLRSAERDELGGVSTLPYLAPERRDGGPATPAADVYAFGVLLFEVLTGRLPIGLELPSELRPGLDPRFDALVKRLLGRRPEERPGLPAVRGELLRLLRQESREGRLSADDGLMVRIPAGFVVIGDRDDPQARPMFERELPAFWLDATPVTHRAYLDYVRETRAPRPRGWPRGRLPRRVLEHPVTGITYAEALAYAAWAGKRLPTELEWERAAQGPEHRRFPYGESFDAAKIQAAGLGPVGQHPLGASSEGIHDLTGNGWEWTSSPFVPYGSPPDPGDRSRSIRGGYDPRRPGSGSATYRAGLREDIADPRVGFRCARDCEDGG